MKEDVVEEKAKASGDHHSPSNGEGLAKAMKAVKKTAAIKATKEMAAMKALGGLHGDLRAQQGRPPSSTKNAA